MADTPELTKNQLFHLLKTKPATWNQIREAFPKFVPNLSKANLVDAKLALITVAIAAGATGFSHVNDSGFWMISRYFGMSEAQTRDYGSLLMGLFYAGYGLANIFLTPLAARLGPRRSLVIIVTLWSLFTALGAWVSQWLTLLMATRVLLGLSEGVHVPMMSQLNNAQACAFRMFRAVDVRQDKS